MRGKLAKKLRRLAREALPESEQKAYLQHKKTGQVILGKCDRAVYQSAKKAHQNGLLTETRPSTESGQ